MRRVAALLLLCILSINCSVHAQTATSRFEAGVETSYQYRSLPAFTPIFNNPTYPFENVFQMGGRFVWNISSTVALESEIDFAPRHFPVSVVEGGQVLSAFAGPRVVILRSRRFGFFGAFRPGVLSSGHVCNVILVPVNTFTCSFERDTHFALDLRGSAEFYPTRRWILRANAGETLAAMYDRAAVLHCGSTASISLVTPGAVRPQVSFGMGIGYRFGALREDTGVSNPVRPTRFEAGAQFGLLTRGFSTLFSSSAHAVTTDGGPGGWFTWNLSRHFSIDSSVSFLPNHENELVNFQDGGNAWQGLFGVKAGTRRQHVGYFLKARPGFVQYSRTLANFNFDATHAPQFSSNRYPVLDLGAVMEVYTWRRTMLRFDAGDTLAFIPDRTLIHFVPTLPTATGLGEVRHSIQLATGFGFRF